jgi:deoxyribodipyrimidine photo-lyase
MHSVPEIRIQKANDAPVRSEGQYVLYWMIAFRRTSWNYSLDRAVEWAAELDKPLVILEALRNGYPWASDRLHAFIINGMAENARQLESTPVTYHPYVEVEREAGKGLLQTLSKNACVVVTDDFPAFFLPRMVTSAARDLSVLLEKVDSNGLLPMRAADRIYPSAFALRRFLQKHLPNFLVEHPEMTPLEGLSLKRIQTLPQQILKRWPKATEDIMEADPSALAVFPIDHNVGIAEMRGGSDAGISLLEEFVQDKFSKYGEYRNRPEEEVTSGLSPYLHFGHISAHQVFHRIAENEGWFFDRLAPTTKGNRRGWWGMSESAEVFLDQLITWRELGFNMCWQQEKYDQYDSLPDWAAQTLKAHELDERPYIYSRQDFEQAQTHDRLWNAAQTQLVTEGRIHNYLRMLWGKKIIEWSPTPNHALDVMVELNNKYALDGRDPNSYSGIFWCLGRYDRPFGPERPVFGKIRYMSSKNTARKVSVQYYVEKYAP